MLYCHYWTNYLWYIISYRCKKQIFPHISLNASIIICFYNEEPHTLYRTVFSVLDRTPSNLLHEILLVDDNSDRGISRITITLKINNTTNKH